jgi:DNA-directed RNA polymerase specialized sigma subunit
VIKEKYYQDTLKLLKNYQAFKIHCEVADESIDVSDYDVLEAFVKGKDKNLSDYITSIARTRARTQVMLKIVDRYLDEYKKVSETSKRKDAINRYNVIDLMYLSDTLSMEEVAYRIPCDVSTVSRWHKTAIYELSTYFWGVEGVLFKVLQSS